jgi:hypothetical protein
MPKFERRLLIALTKFERRLVVALLTVVFLGLGTMHLMAKSPVPVMAKFPELMAPSPSGCDPAPDATRSWAPHERN